MPGTAIFLAGTRFHGVADLCADNAEPAAVILAQQLPHLAKPNPSGRPRHSKQRAPASTHAFVSTQRAHAHRSSQRCCQAAAAMSRRGRRPRSAWPLEAAANVTAARSREPALPQQLPQSWSKHTSTEDDPHTYAHNSLAALL
eukprot:6202244-Pleurochrysis_carterae.AAC.3